jgi:23S rRNA (cytosine1962-C5)-methyltransferase
MANWNWIETLPGDLNDLNAINLFAHTGATTIALARRGMRVVHVDSAKKMVGWARNNSADSGLADHPIRWIVEDVMKFLRRELKRGKRYDFIVADPPAFGHGFGKSRWKLDHDVADLLAVLSKLTSPRFVGLLFTVHSYGFNDRHLAQLIARHLRLPNNDLEHGAMNLKSSAKGTLNAGHFVRWNRQ